MPQLHRLLERQIRKFISADGTIPDHILEFVYAVNESYRLYEENRQLIERAMRLGSEELQEKNELLQSAYDKQQMLIGELKQAVHEVSPEHLDVEDSDLIQITHFLKQAIEDRKSVERDLVNARSVAEASLEARKLFLANISHEIRTPMNAILGIAALLKESDLSQTQSDYVKAIQTSANGLMVIINDVLDVSKIESGKFTLEKIPFNLKDLIQPIIRGMGTRASEKGIDLDLHLDPAAGPALIGDPTRIGQVLANLVSNAIKFTATGSVELRVEMQFEVNNLQQVLFEVEDTGIGIESEKLDTIFEQFEQADISITRKYGGTGLGLSISKSLVELMGGKLQVRSKPGVGSTFSFSLTLLKTELQEAVQSVSVFASYDLKGITVLLVEDNELNRFLAITLLQKWNAVVEVATNGEEALDIISGSLPDIVLMDLQMPVMDGFATTDKIRTTYNLSLPIIALTANALESERIKCMEAGMNDCVSKPYQAKELFDAIARQLPHILNEKQEYSSYSLDKLHVMYEGNKKNIKKTIAVFLKQIENDMKELSTAVSAREYKAVQSILHKMHSSIELFEMREVKKIMALLREDAIERNPDALNKRLEKLFPAIHEVSEALMKETAKY
jgi:signal transduction histidine kinase/CheY-like chemotaxis protein/HPt (histidine-containing phosphotransfer) domain-containing protein